MQICLFSWDQIAQPISASSRSDQCSATAPSSISGEGGAPVVLVVSLNLHRRHLTESQRAMVATKLATMQRGHPQENAQIYAFSWAG
jgi:hypothetical protein